MVDSGKPETFYVCDVCDKPKVIGECCRGVKYCSITCQEAHSDEEMDEAVGDGR